MVLGQGEEVTASLRFSVVERETLQKGVPILIKYIC